ncbi:homeobox protein Hox-A13-like [Schistocerca serialis cubense]|uniref:homeobox protein Hox-A13-like n=1 Tax=Schistocerca serialis cubense TaxID=2023355 RepID=UPI00214E18E6|nr:homeobox protein Hox-A13-like [Schistocerca serialis cubense]
MAALSSWLLRALRRRGPELEMELELELERLQRRPAVRTQVPTECREGGGGGGGADVPWLGSELAQRCVAVAAAAAVTSGWTRGAGASGRVGSCPGRCASPLVAGCAPAAAAAVAAAGGSTRPLRTGCAHVRTARRSAEHWRTAQSRQPASQPASLISRGRGARPGRCCRLAAPAPQQRRNPRHRTCRPPTTAGVSAAESHACH